MSPRRRIPEGLDDCRTFSHESSPSTGDIEVNELDETMPYSPVTRRLAPYSPVTRRLASYSPTSRRLARAPFAGIYCDHVDTRKPFCTSTAAGNRCKSAAISGCNSAAGSGCTFTAGSGCDSAAGSGCTSTAGSGCDSAAGSGCDSTAGSGCNFAAGCEHRCNSAAYTDSLSTISSHGSEGDDPPNKLLAMDLYILAIGSREKDLDEEYMIDAVRHLHGLCSINVVESHHFTKKRVLETLKAVLERSASCDLKLAIAKLLLKLWEDSSYWGRVRITNVIADEVILKHCNGTENEQLEKIACYLQEEYYRLSSNL